MKFLIFILDLIVLGIFIGNPLARKYEEILREMKNKKKSRKITNGHEGHCPKPTKFSNHGDYWIYRNWLQINILSVGLGLVRFSLGVNLNSKTLY